MVKENQCHIYILAHQFPIHKLNLYLFLFFYLYILQNLKDILGGKRKPVWQNGRQFASGRASSRRQSEKSFRKNTQWRQYPIYISYQYLGDRASSRRQSGKSFKKIHSGNSILSLGDLSSSRPQSEKKKYTLVKVWISDLYCFSKKREKLVFEKHQY